MTQTDGTAIRAEHLIYLLDQQRAIAEPADGAQVRPVAASLCRCKEIGSMSLSLESVSISIGGRQLVRSVDLTLHPGEVVGLLGPNGAGKTTTFNLVIGLLRPDAGTIRLNGGDVTERTMPERARLGVGYLPQEPSVFRNLTVRQNLQIALDQTGLSSSARRSRRDQLIEEFHLESFLERLGYQLSGGERRRCEVARALAVDQDGPMFFSWTNRLPGLTLRLLIFSS